MTRTQLEQLATLHDGTPRASALADFVVLQATRHEHRIESRLATAAPRVATAPVRDRIAPVPGLHRVPSPGGLVQAILDKVQGLRNAVVPPRTPTPTPTADYVPAPRGLAHGLERNDR